MNATMNNVSSFRASDNKLAKITKLQDCHSIDDLLRASSTDWDVQVMPAGILGAPINSGGFSAIVRPDTNTALAYVGGRYRTNSHRAQLYTLDAMVRSGTLVPETVSLWDNGAVLAYQFRCPDLDVTILDKDVVSPLLTLAFSYGSKLADSAFFCDFRWYCSNQMGRVAKLNSNGRVKHRGDVVNRFGDVLQERIGELSGELSEHYGTMRKLPETPLQGKRLCEYFAASLGMTEEDANKAWNYPADELEGEAKRIPEVLECYRVDDCGAPGTVWQAYNAVTRYETHKVGRNAETRQRRMLLGAGDDIARNAWDKAAELVSVAA